MGINRAKRREKMAAMLIPWLAGTSTALILCLSLSADAEEPTRKSEAPQVAVEAKPDAETTGEFKPPPGFRARKRGEVVVYCRKETALGSRFAAEKCYDQVGLRELRLAELERAEMLERVRACTTGSCSTN
jgi:hypothetical protein